MVHETFNLIAGVVELRNAYQLEYYSNNQTTDLTTYILMFNAGKCLFWRN